MCKYVVRPQSLYSLTDMYGKDIFEQHRVYFVYNVGLFFLLDEIFVPQVVDSVHVFRLTVHEVEDERHEKHTHDVGSFGA